MMPQYMLPMMSDDSFSMLQTRKEKRWSVLSVVGQFSAVES